MRLKQNEIKSTILKYIKDAKVLLFGSRVYDDKRGGDIDIYVETKKNIDLSTQLKILTSIELAGLIRKVKTPYSKESSIFDTAKKEGVVL